ncbi:hypothetical protein NQ314_018675 [Rhamnusium bicolor]|uniref:Rabaptin GTPase-Rab5 binding domain-containing protein n=1 Tax=Rhamnusium bicolor TaxID=1586634 RepID=A0AAV8WQ38_9CUCU|nr:hypothetical protein NQ314_018675 [Rhamnusium bicolor]
MKKEVLVELHELVLKNHQELIIAKIGKEATEEKLNSLQSDIMLLKDQITNDQYERKSIEETLDQEIKAQRYVLFTVEIMCMGIFIFIIMLYLKHYLFLTNVGKCCEHL